MKKFFKIFGITLASLVGVVLIVACVAVWIVFTPEKLTSIVRTQAAKYITCEHQIGQVELTFFSTFPQFGLKVDGVTLINPMPNAPSDTVADLQTLVAKINLGELIKHNAVVLDEFNLKNMQANVFVDTAGVANYDVFVSDTLPDEEDTTAFSIPFDAVRLQTVKLSGVQLSYTDLSSNIVAVAHDVKADFDMDMQGTEVAGKLLLNLPDISLQMDSDVYLQNAVMSLNAPLHANIADMKLTLDKARLSLNEFSVGLQGSVAMPDNGDMLLDMAFDIADWQIKPLLAIVPAVFTSALDGIDVDGVLGLSGTVSGVFNDSLMPYVSANLKLADGDFKMDGLPYHITDLKADAVAEIDLNNGDSCFARINLFEGQTGQSSIKATGLAERLLGDNMIIDVTLNADLNLPEVEPMMPEDMDVSLQGRMKGWARAKLTMKQLDEMDIPNMDITGDFDLKNLKFYYDSMWVDADKGNLKLTIPNKTAQKADLKFLMANLQCDNLIYKQGADLVANVHSADLALQTSNILSDDRYLSASCNFNIDGLQASMDDISGNITKPSGTAYIKMDMQDSTALPMLMADVKMESLKGSMDTISADIANPALKVSLTGTRKDKTQPRIRIDYDCSSLSAAMGTYLSAQTDKLSIVANARQDASQENLLLQWNPRLNVDLQNGKISMADFPEDILIPEIKFDFNNRKFVINDSRFVLGNSDFQLQGEVKNIGEWLSNKGLLTGELDFVSNVTDVNQLMELTSGMGSSTDSTQVAEATTASADTAAVQEADPYMVPKGIDFVLHTNLKKAYVGKQIATNVGGNLYVQDGVLMLEEIGFICDAAKMQLTATYKTPRKNHLYVGFIYHMVDVHIEELASMFPEVIEMVPMLSSFKGKAEMHLTAETYTDAYYNPKVSTLRGACAIQGKDLVVLDGETFSEISKLLMFNKKTENVIDTLYAEIGVFKDKIDVYPLLITMDKYQAAVGGHHYLNMDVDYHVSLLKPLRIGLSIGGNIDDMNFKVGKCLYAEDFKQKKENVVETQNERMRKIIRESINKTMTIKSGE